MDGIIGEMNKFVFEFFKVKDLAWCTDVSLFVPVSFEDAINTGQHHEMPYVELSVIIEERFIDVRLHNVGKGLSIFVLCLLYQLSYISKWGELYTSSSIRILTRLYNPDLIRLTFILLHKDSIVLIFKGSDVISFWYIIEWIFMLYFRKIMVQRLKEIFLWAYAVVPREMVGEYIRDECLLKRNKKPLLSNKTLDLLCLFNR